MATDNISRQNYGNPFTVGSSMVQGTDATAPGFVDYSQFFDTSATPGLQAAQQALFTQIALANEQHAKNMENILPANFDETKLAPGSFDGTYEMFRNLKDQAYDLSRTASNFRGTKKGDMAQMELNKIKSQMSKHYGNNVEYNSMMLDHNKNKDYYSQSFNVIPGKAEEYQRYVKFVDPTAKISYDGKQMMITAEDGEKISFEELKKLEPAMQETELNLGIDQLATTITTEASNGKKVNDATIDFTIANLLNKAYQGNGDKLSVLTSLATDMSKEIGGQKFDFYGYIASDTNLATKYLNSDGKFNIPEDPSARAEYAKNFESDFKSYLRGTMQTVRDSSIEAYTNDVRAEEERKINLEVEKQKKILGFRNENKVIDYSSLDTKIKQLYDQFNKGDLYGIIDAANASRDIRAEGKYVIAPRADENGNDMPGEFELFDAKGQSTGRYFSTNGDEATKKAEFDKLMGFISGDLETAYNRKGGLGGTLAFESDVVGGKKPVIDSGPATEKIRKERENAMKGAIGQRDIIDNKIVEYVNSPTNDGDAWDYKHLYDLTTNYIKVQGDNLKDGAKLMVLPDNIDEQERASIEEEVNNQIELMKGDKINKNIFEPMYGGGGAGPGGRPAKSGLGYGEEDVRKILTYIEYIRRTKR